MSQSSILFLSTQLPYPPNSGGTIKSWKYLKDLSKRYQLGLACLLKDNDDQHLAEFKTKVELKEFIHQDLNIQRSPLTLLKSYLGFPSLNVYRNHSKGLMKQVEASAGNYEVILVDHYEMFQYVPKNYQGRVVLHTHNAEFALWQRMAEVTKNPMLRLALKLESRRVLKYEKRIIHKADLTYATPSDIESFKAAGIVSSNIKLTYHLGNDELLNSSAIEFVQTERALLFMGTLSWEPNIDGLLWFIDQVYPHLIETHPDLKLYVLGQLADSRLEKAAEKYKGIKLCGFVEDIDQYLSKSRVFIAPLRFGSGMKVKVLEGMYRGLPIVTTEIGAEGIDARDGEELMVAKNAKAFTEKTLTLLQEKEVWEKLRDQSRKKAAEQYTWQPLFDSMDIELSSLL